MEQNLAEVLDDSSFTFSKEASPLKSRETKTISLILSINK
jgi:hypothetical protein